MGGRSRVAAAAIIISFFLTFFARALARYMRRGRVGDSFRDNRDMSRDIFGTNWDNRDSIGTRSRALALCLFRSPSAFMADAYHSYPGGPALASDQGRVTCRIR